MSEAIDTGLKSARPSIQIAGADQPDLASGLLNMVIAENTTGLYRCEATFSNWGTKDSQTGFLYFDRRLLDFGKDFRIKLGNDTLFDGKIMALEASFPEGQPSEITLLAEDRFQDLRMTRRTRTFNDVSDADVFRQIASDHGLTPNVNLTGPTYKVLAQVNQSDLAFLRERARSIDAEIWMDGNNLNAQLRASRNNGTLQMQHGNKLREFTVTADLANQRTSVTVSGWDVSSKSEIKHEAEESAIKSEVGSDTSGISILSSAFGTRKDAVAHTVPLTSQEAQFEAEAFFKKCARRFVTGCGVAETDSKLRVGIYVDLQGIGPLFSGKYYVAEVKHMFDNSKGTRTQFMAERPGIGQT